MNNKKFNLMMGGELSRLLVDHVVLINGQALQTDMAKKRSAEALNDLDQLETAQLTVENGARVWGVSSQQNVSWLILLLGIVAAYLIDYLLFKPTIEYLIWRFSGTDITTPSLQLSILQALIPALVIIFELNIATHLFTLRKNRARGYWVYFFLGVLSILVMPCLVAATLLAGQPNWTSVYQLQLFALFVLSAIAHIIVLFGGSEALEAKTYILLRFRVYRLRRKSNRADIIYQRWVQRVCGSYVIYKQTLETYNAAYPDRTQTPALFTKYAQELLDEHFSKNGFPRLGDLGKEEGSA